MESGDHCGCFQLAAPGEHAHVGTHLRRSSVRSALAFASISALAVVLATCEGLAAGSLRTVSRLRRLGDLLRDCGLLLLLLHRLRLLSGDLLPRLSLRKE